MLTIALDETGNFEKIHDELKFIGGLAYSGTNEKEKNLQLIAHLKDVFQKHKLQFPQDLHGNKIKLEIRTAVLKDVLSFFKKQREFRFIGIVKSNKPFSKNIHFSNLTDENIASNLHENMLSRLLSNVLFFNTYYHDESSVKLKIAKRVVNIDIDDTETHEIYRKLGYNGQKKFDSYNQKDVMRFYLSDPNLFKSALATKLLELPYTQQLDCELDVKSIDYYESNEDKMDGFLYMADLICSYVRLTLKEPYEEHAIKGFYQNIRNYFPQTLLFAYDEIDEQWNQLYKEFATNDYLQALDLLYTIEHSSSPYKIFYTSDLTSQIQQNLPSKFKMGLLKSYISELDFQVRSKNNDRDFQKEIFIGHTLWEQFDDEGSTESASQKFYLADLMQRLYNHQGNIEKAELFNEYCYTYRKYVSPIDYCATYLNSIQTAFNGFDYETGKKEIDEAILILEEVQQSYKKIAKLLKQDADSVKIPVLGKFYSSLGQYYSFTNEPAQALHYFEKAIQQFDSPSEAYMTWSFILHLAANIKDESLFEHYASHVFIHGTTIEARWKQIQNKFKIFEFYIFVKAAVAFNWTLQDKIQKEILEIALTFENHIYPAPIIYKYVGMLTHVKGQVEHVEELLRRIRLSRYSATDSVISYSSEIFYYNSAKPEDEQTIQKLISQLKQACKSNATIGKYFSDVATVEDLKHKIAFNIV